MDLAARRVKWVSEAKLGHKDRLANLELPVRMAWRVPLARAARKAMRAQRALMGHQGLLAKLVRKVRLGRRVHQALTERMVAASSHLLAILTAPGRLPIRMARP